MNSWLAVAYEDNFYIGRVKSFCKNGELKIAFVEKLDGRYHWPVRKDVDRKFILSGVEMRASGKHFELIHPTEKELTKKHRDYCKEFFIAEKSGSDCDITTMSPPNPITEFSPIDKKWQTAKCSELKLKFNATIPSKPQNMSIFSPPEQKVDVIPDGNCFFRSICYWLTGDIAMKEHQKIRSAVVSFMREKWCKQGKRIVGRNYDDYLQNARMEEEGTWATENEIFATADLLGTTIMVFTEGMTKYKWVTHNPSTLKGKGCSEQKIYLINECKHYQPVIGICK